MKGRSFPFPAAFPLNFDAFSPPLAHFLMPKVVQKARSISLLPSPLPPLPASTFQPLWKLMWAEGRSRTVRKKGWRKALSRPKHAPFRHGLVLKLTSTFMRMRLALSRSYQMFSPTNHVRSCSTWR